MSFLTKVRKAATKKFLDFSNQVRNPVRKILKVILGFCDQNQREPGKNSKRAMFALLSNYFNFQPRAGIILEKNSIRTMTNSKRGIFTLYGFPN